MEGEIQQRLGLENQNILQDGAETQIPTWNATPGIQPGSDVVFFRNVLGMLPGIWRICLIPSTFLPGLGSVWEKIPPWNAGMDFPSQPQLPVPVGVFWDWDGSGSKLFQLFNTDFPNLFPVSFFQEKAPQKKMGKMGGGISKEQKIPTVEFCPGKEKFGNGGGGGNLGTNPEFIDPLWNSGIPEVSRIRGKPTQPSCSCRSLGILDPFSLKP